jgi:carbamoyl-phosphate synthase small subunit
MGARTYKMKFGHHGVNNPVRDESTGAILITSQNHGFAVDEESLPRGAEIWFRNANDSTNEGLREPARRIATVQFHPEAAPGPRDSLWIFRRFLETL